MAREELQIIISAKDQASGILGNITGKLGILGKVGGGLNLIAGAAILGGVVVAAGAATAAIGGLALGLKSAVSEAMEAQEVQAQLAQVIKSTGGAAGVTADMVNKLAESLASETRYGEEAVIGADNLLLTFTAIGKDILPAVTEAVLDMSTAMGQDLKSSAIQIGKAMQDPITGAGALRRVGVQLTDAQEELIKKMVESGDVMGAQKMILAELTKEFGGSAKAAGKTFAGQLDILHNALSEIAEDVGNVLLPYLTGGMQRLVPVIKNVANTFAGWLKSTTFQDWFRKAIDWVVGLAEKFSTFISGNKFMGWMKDIAGFINGRLLPRLQEMGGWIGRELVSLFGKLGTFIKTIVFPILSRLWQWMATNLPLAIMTVVTFFNRNLLPALTKVAQWVMANVVPALAQLWDYLEHKLISAIPVVGAWITKTLVPALISLGQWITTTVIPAIGVVVNWLSVNLPPAIAATSQWITGTLIPALTTVANWIKNNLIPALQDIWNWLSINLPPALEKFGVWWTTTLIPALTIAYNYLKMNIIPAFIELYNIFTINLLPILMKFDSYLIGEIPKALEGLGIALGIGILIVKQFWDGFVAVVDILKIVVDWFVKVGDTIDKLELPDWLKPGSPTPLEMGLRGINSALKQVSMSGLSFGGPQVLMAGGAAGGGMSMGAVTVVYSPGMSLGSQSEFETKFIPMLTRALKKVKRGAV